MTTTPITVPETLNPAAVQDKTNEMKIVEFILNVAANADIATGSQRVFEPGAFVTGIKKLVCYYANDKNGERYLINYADCAARLKVTIAEVIPYDGVMKAVLNPPPSDPIAPGSAGSASGRSRRATGPQTLVRFYVYELPLTSESIVQGDEIVEAKVRAPKTFVESEFGYGIDQAWTIEDRNKPLSPSNVGGANIDANVGETVSDSNTVLWGVVVGVLAVAMFSLVGIVVWSQRSRRNQSQPFVTWDKAFSDSGSLTGISDWDGVARALADHGLDAGSGWGGDAGSNGGGNYERVLGLLSGAASVAPSTNYLDVTRNAIRPRPVSMSSHYDQDLTDHYNAVADGRRPSSPGIASTTSHHDNVRAEMDDGYLALDSEELNPPVFAGLGGGAASQQPPDTKLDSLLAMKAACDAQLEAMTSKNGDTFDNATRQMLAFTQQSLISQVDELRKSQSPDFAATSPLPEVSLGGGGGHYYPTQTGLGVEPIVSTATVPLQAGVSKVNTGVGLKLPRGPSHFVPGDSINGRPTLSADSEFTATINGLGGNF